MTDELCVEDDELLVALDKIDDEQTKNIIIGYIAGIQERQLKAMNELRSKIAAMQRVLERLLE